MDNLRRLWPVAPMLLRPAPTLDHLGNGLNGFASGLNSGLFASGLTATLFANGITTGLFASGLLNGLFANGLLNGLFASGLGNGFNMAFPFLRLWPLLRPAPRYHGSIAAPCLRLAFHWSNDMPGLPVCRKRANNF